MVDLGGTIAALTLLLCVPVASQSLNVNSAAEAPSRNVVSQGDTALRYVPQPPLINGSNTVIHSNISILGDDYQNDGSNISILGDDYENDGDASEVDVSMCGITLRILKANLSRIWEGGGGREGGEGEGLYHTDGKCH